MKKLFFIFFISFTLISCSEDEDFETSVRDLMFNEITQNSVSLKWDLKLKKIERFEVYRNSVLISTLEDTNIRMYRDTNLTPNTTYNYYVKVIIDNETFIKVNGTARTKK